MPRARPAIERFFDFVEVTEGCWLWTGGCLRTGYGRFGLAPRRQILSHRWTYENLVGPVPPGLVLDHLCGVRACVNPDHLEPVTQAENVRRTVAQKTHCAQGHPWMAENIQSNGHHRRCRICHNAEGRRRYSERRQEWV